MEIHISFTAEPLFHVAGVPITNALFTAAVVSVLIIIAVFSLRSKLSVTAPTKLELFWEMIINAMRDQLYSILGKKKTVTFLPILFTFAIFILGSNLFGLLPFVPALGIAEEAHVVHENIVPCLLSGDCLLTTKGVVEAEKFLPVFRAPTADLSATLTLALLAVFIINGVGIAYNGLKFLKRYADFSNPLNAFISILEGISEIGKIISFAFRLFGNVFAGEVLLAVITSITFGIATLPFLVLELFVGFIQALVFFLLVAVFIGLASEEQHH
jgi:F-type H+-transporting ATPase subunit a